MCWFSYPTIHYTLSLIYYPPQIKGLEEASLKLWLISKRQFHSTASSSTSGPPRCRYVNMSVLLGTSIKSGGTTSTLLLENPVGENVLSYERLLLEVRTTELCS